MARKKKNHVDYFPHDTHQSKAVRTISKTYGNDGYAFYYKLRELLGRTDNYNYDLSEQIDWFDFLGEMAIKEEQAHLAKSELLVLWTDYFKPPHLEKFPNLHETFWKAAKLCSSVKVEVSAVHAQELMDAIKEIHEMFWASKGREVTWYTAS